MKKMPDKIALHLRRDIHPSGSLLPSPHSRADDVPCARPGASLSGYGARHLDGRAPQDTVHATALFPEVLGLSELLVRAQVMLPGNQLLTILTRS